MDRGCCSGAGEKCERGRCGGAVCLAPVVGRPEQLHPNVQDGLLDAPVEVGAGGGTADDGAARPETPLPDDDLGSGGSETNVFGAPGLGAFRLLRVPVCSMLYIYVCHLLSTAVIHMHVHSSCTVRVLELQYTQLPSTKRVHGRSALTPSPCVLWCCEGGGVWVWAVVAPQRGSRHQGCMRAVAPGVSSSAPSPLWRRFGDTVRCVCCCPFGSCVLACMRAVLHACMYVRADVLHP